MFNPGDKFIRFSKYGSTHMGVVKSYGERFRVEITQTYKVRMSVPYIVSENGVVYELDGSDGKIYRVNYEYTEEEHTILKEKLSILKHKNPFNERRSNRGLER
jgi:hypothetical protein